MTSFPVIVTSSSKKFFGSLQGLLKSVYEFVVPKYKDVKVLLFDMGLTTEQVAQEALREFNWVWWMDSSARIITSDLDRALQYSIENSMLFFTYDQTSNIAKHTDIRTMLHLREDRCKYRYFGEIEAGFVLYHFDDVTKTVVDSWSACALTERCISPSRVSKWPMKVSAREIIRSVLVSEWPMKVSAREIIRRVLVSEWPMKVSAREIIRRVLVSEWPMKVSAREIIRRVLVFDFPMAR
ncbi:hypothetical protein MAR_003444, partial [Mya arenaria]